jgi:hypothetical protein
MVEDSRAMLDALLSEFGKSIGMPDLKTNDEGISTLVFDGRIEIDILADPNTGSAVLWCILGELPASDTAGAQRRLLEANLFWQRTRGATLSLMPNSNDVVVAMRGPLPGMNVETLRTLIETMVETSEELTRLLTPQAAASGDSPIPIGLRA